MGHGDASTCIVLAKRYGELNNIVSDGGSRLLQGRGNIEVGVGGMQHARLMFSCYKQEFLVSDSASDWANSTLVAVRVDVKSRNAE